MRSPLIIREKNLISRHNLDTSNKVEIILTDSQLQEKVKQTSCILRSSLLYNKNGGKFTYHYK